MADELDFDEDFYLRLYEDVTEAAATGLFPSGRAALAVPNDPGLNFRRPEQHFLELILKRRDLSSQSLTFLRGSTQSYHQDNLFVPFTFPMQFAASWIVLEDVAVGGGELTYFPGSHQMPERLHAGRCRTFWDAQRVLRRNSSREEITNYSSELEERWRRGALTAQTFMANRGDVLFCHVDLAHGGMPIRDERTRAGVVIHYCPEKVAPLTFECGQTFLRSHENLCWYATGHYSDSEQGRG